MDLETALEWAANRRLATLATIRADGRPQTSDVVYGLIDGQFLITVAPNRAKTANLRKDGRSVLHLSQETPPSYLSFDGVTEVHGPPASIDDPIVDRMVAYFEAAKGEPHSDWDEYRQAMVDEKRILLAFIPSSVTGWARD